MFTTANDMAQYMRFHLNRGRVDGEEVIADWAMDDVYRSTNFIPWAQTIRKPKYPVDDTAFTYALGFDHGTYRGNFKVFFLGTCALFVNF